MGFKSINLRNTNERQEGMTYGTVPMSHFLSEVSTLIVSNPFPRPPEAKHLCGQSASDNSKSFGHLPFDRSLIQNGSSFRRRADARNVKQQLILFLHAAR